MKMLINVFKEKGINKKQPNNTKNVIVKEKELNTQRTVFNALH